MHKVDIRLELYVQTNSKEERQFGEKLTELIITRYFQEFWPADLACQCRPGLFHVEENLGLRQAPLIVGFARRALRQAAWGSDLTFLVYVELQ